KHLQLRVLLFETRCLSMNGIGASGLYRTLLIDGLANHIDDSPQCFPAYRHGNGSACVDRFHASNQAIRRLHGDGPDPAFAKMLLNLGDDVDRLCNIESLAGNANRGVNERKSLLIKSHVHCRPNYLNDLADVHACLQSKINLFPSKLDESFNRGCPLSPPN